MAQAYSRSAFTTVHRRDLSRLTFTTHRQPPRRTIHLHIKAKSTSHTTVVNHSSSQGDHHWSSMREKQRRGYTPSSASGAPHGANFAIVGGTALDVGFFLRHNAASVPPFRSSLRAQIGWFCNWLRRSSLCSNGTAGCEEDRRRLVAMSLFVVGELGMNDYGYLLAGGKSVREAKSFDPDVVKAICRGIEVRTVLLFLNSYAYVRPYSTYASSDHITIASRSTPFSP
ncbi:hypothetical protein HU200_053219 [Digitaria exilis]|uniref:Uncharacterized protein n=1 Tax=Digitaria exilis TaxID=1010633 RepID=A0A835AKH2_9POAL|nr:hypothetical protein HU200_053219 [Digitaria exilis]